MVAFSLFLKHSTFEKEMVKKNVQKVKKSEGSQKYVDTRSSPPRALL